MSNVRNVINISGSKYIAIPKNISFNKGESALFEQLDENSCKITKVEYVKKQDNLNIK